jgi:uncharacterized phiE125 gp8 family phage protein
MSLIRLTPIDGEAILPIADCKEHLKVTHSIEDALIGSLRNAAIGYVEKTSGVALAAASFRWSMRDFPLRVTVPVRPVTALTSVTYYDAAGVVQTYSDARLIDGAVLAAAASTWPRAYGAAVEFTAGLTSPDDAPDLIAAVKLMLTHLYQNRGAAQVTEVYEVPLGVNALIRPSRRRLL